jgi:hypothetical protein
MTGLTSASSFPLQKEGVSGERMDYNDKKKKAVAILSSRRGAVAQPVSESNPSLPTKAPGSPTSSPPRFAKQIEKYKGRR